MAHDFKSFPELTNRQMQDYYWESPHRQIAEDFRATVVRVHDGDTIGVYWPERDFIFTVRLSDISAPEIKEPGGIAGRVWLSERILGKEVNIKINMRNRVDRWGRLLGEIIHMGMSMNEEIVKAGRAVLWSERTDVLLPDFFADLEEEK